MKGEKIIEKKLNFNVTTLVIHDKELSDRLLKEAIKEKTTNKTSLICDLLNEAFDYRNGDYKDPCVSMLTNVIDDQNKMKIKDTKYSFYCEEKNSSLIEKKNLNILLLYLIRINMMIVMKNFI